jgi:hypothetical protein
MNLHFLDGYEFAELTAARVSAAKMGFIKNVSEAALAELHAAEEGRRRAPLHGRRAGRDGGAAPGQEIEMFDPKHPSVAFKDFTKTVLRAIARGLNMSYTSLTGDLEAVNYSSIRAGLLSERDHYPRAAALARDPLPSPRLSRVARHGTALERDPARWSPRERLLRRRMAAARLEVGGSGQRPHRCGTRDRARPRQSRQRLAAEQGRDFEDVVEEIAHELEFAEAMGVDVSGTVLRTAAANHNRRTTRPPPGADKSDGADGSRRMATKTGRRRRMPAARAAESHPPDPGAQDRPSPSRTTRAA